MDNSYSQAHTNAHHQQMYHIAPLKPFTPKNYNVCTKTLKRNKEQILF